MKNILKHGKYEKHERKLYTINFLVNIDKVSSFCIKSHVKTSIFFWLSFYYYFYLPAMKKHKNKNNNKNNNNNILTVFEAFGMKEIC